LKIRPVPTKFLTYEIEMPVAALKENDTATG
jgi:hypothetical protein